MQDETSRFSGSQRRRDVLRTLGAGALAVGVAGCNGGTSGDGTDTDGNDDDTTTNDQTATPASTPDPNCETPVEVSDPVESDTVWNCQQYLLTRDLHVRGDATLTIAAGVEVVAQQSVRLIVESDASLVIDGTANQPVVVRGEQDTTGYWDGIEFDTASTASELTYADIRNGGNGDWANVYVQNGSAVSLQNCTLRDCSTYGVIAESETSFPAFAANTFEGNEQGAMQVPANSLGDIDSASTYANGSGPDRIAVTNERVTEDATWPATDGWITFVSDGRIGAAVTVDPGALFAFAQSARLIVESGGSLSAVGGASDRIIFAGTTDVSGYWDGIEIDSNNPNNRFENVDISHGGNGDWANIYVQNGSMVSLSNCTFRDCSTYGVIAESETSFPTFEQNTFEGNTDGAIKVPANSLGALDSASTYAGGNGTDRITVTNERVTEDAIWTATDAPIFFSSDGRIGAAVTVDPGAQFTFDQSARLIVESGGSLDAVGGSSNRITFEGATKTPGYWDGIEFASLDPKNVLENCLIAHGGNGGWANVYVQSTGMATVRNCEIRDSATSGIHAESGARLTESGNRFSNVPDGGVIGP